MRLTSVPKAASVEGMTTSTKTLPLDREDRMLVRDYYRMLRATGWSREGAKRKAIILVTELEGS